MSYKPNSTAHTKTFTSFNFLLNSKKLIRLQEKKLKPRVVKTLKTPSCHPALAPVKLFDSSDRCLSEDASPKHKFKEINSRMESKKEVKESTIYQKISKIRNSCSPATIYGMNMMGEKPAIMTRPKLNKKTKSVIPAESLHLNLANLKNSQNSTSKKKLTINVDAVGEFEKPEDQKDDNDENENSDSGRQNDNEKGFKDNESDEENSAYLDSSWREIKKEIKNTEKNHSFKEQEKKTHEEIITILKQINHSDVFLFHGLANKNVRQIHDVRANNDVTDHGQMKTINEIISPNKRLLKDPMNFNLIESKANRFNVKNKRITLQSFVTRSEWETEKNGAFPLIDARPGAKILKNGNNNKYLKREFYSKWYLPVDYWKIPKPERKRHLLDTPLKYGYFLFFKKYSRETIFR